MSTVLRKSSRSGINQDPPEKEAALVALNQVSRRALSCLTECFEKLVAKGPQVTRKLDQDLT